MNIKDYLHLYLGHQCLIRFADDNPDGHYDVIYCDCIKGYLNDSDETMIQPILRPLSDMTEEEGIEVCKFVVAEKRQNQIDLQELTSNHIWYIDGEMWHSDGVSEVYDKYINFNELSADQFRYMLSKGFDIFNLIDAGLAIDKTKLKTLKQKKV